MDAKAAAVVVVVVGDEAVVFDCAVTKDKKLEEKQQVRRRRESMLRATGYWRCTMLGSGLIRPGDLPLLELIWRVRQKSLAGVCLLPGHARHGGCLSYLT